MKPSKEIYEKVGCACSKYKAKPFPGQVYNLAGESNTLKPSCLSCTHFTDGHCDLDMYDKVVKQIHI